jgi:lysophospholipase L1-like esterase
LKRVLLIFVLIVASYSYGVYSHKAQTFPYWPLKLILPFSQKQPAPVAPHEYRQHLFEEMSVTKRSVVMIGDSIIEAIDWNELLDRCDVLNRGIAGDTTSDVLLRLKTICRSKLDLAILLMGVNDFRRGTPVEKAFENYKEVIGELTRSGIRPVVLTTLHVNPGQRREPGIATVNGKVDELNRKLSAYCAEGNCTFIDVSRQLSSKGALREDVTYDGIHLNARGYMIMGAEIKRALVLPSVSFQTCSPRSLWC